MIKLLGFLIHGCWHRWRLVKSIDLYNSDVSSTTPVGNRLYFKCDQCGRFKKQDLK